MIERDFTNCPQKIQKSYLGANGSKKCLIIDGVDYMVKFPALPTKKTELSYANSCVSEYLGCHIFEIAEIPVQKTILGTYNTTTGNTKLVVACKDVTKPGIELIPFAGLKNQIVDSSRNGYGTELSEILKTFSEQTLFPEEEICSRFWDMFIVDALIGNWDRHNGNWGYLYDSINNEVALAPVYDCGSSLFPQADEKNMQAVLTDVNELKQRVYQRPLSSIKIDDKKINYRDFILSLENEDCNKSLKNIFPKLSQEKINKLIDETPYISNLQKDFYKLILNSRRELILEKAYNKLIEKEKTIEKNAVFIQSPVDLCNKYMEVLLESSKSLSLKESMKKAYETVIETSDKVTTSLNKHMFKSYFNNMGIKTGKDFEEYFQKEINKAKEQSLKIKPSKKRDVDIGYGY